MKEPESLEETQRRLAGVGSMPDEPETTAPTPRGRFGVLVGVAAVLALGGVGVAVALLVASPAPDWTAYPGSDFRTVDEVLAADSLETIAAESDAFTEEYKNALTDEFGITWTERTPPAVNPDVNGYGGDSMLYSYSGGEWQGAVTMDDPAARERIYDLFEQLAYAHLATDVFTWNDYTSVGKVDQYGAAEKADQVVWELIGSGSDTHPVRFTSVLYDRSLPADPTFGGTTWIRIEEGDTNTFFVYLFAHSYALLAEADREAFIEAVEPYAGHTPPGQ